MSIKEWYTNIPYKHCVFHIAKCWSRYNSNDKYFGGIVKFNKDDFREIDGFPNVYWGWGGEDDELYKRVSNFKIIGPSKELTDAIIDLENLTVQEKLAVLKESDEKCKFKWEANDDHDEHRVYKIKPHWWGLVGLKYSDEIISTSIISNYSVKIMANTDWNYDHWTNNYLQKRQYLKINNCKLSNAFDLGKLVIDNKLYYTISVGVSDYSTQVCEALKIINNERAIHLIIGQNHLQNEYPDTVKFYDEVPYIAVPKVFESILNGSIDKFHLVIVGYKKFTPFHEMIVNTMNANNILQIGGFLVFPIKEQKTEQYLKLFDYISKNFKFLNVVYDNNDGIILQKIGEDNREWNAYVPF
jgi:hypothetical protein